MYDLVFLISMTLVSPNHNSLASCQNAIRQIYTQQVDPLKVMSTQDLKTNVDIKIKWQAPKEFICVKKA